MTDRAGLLLLLQLCQWVPKQQQQQQGSQAAAAAAAGLQQQQQQQGSQVVARGSCCLKLESLACARGRADVVVGQAGMVHQPLLCGPVTKQVSAVGAEAQQ
jgi:hypothetical protein